MTLVYLHHAEDGVAFSVIIPTYNNQLSEIQNQCLKQAGLRCLEFLREEHPEIYEETVFLDLNTCTFLDIQSIVYANFADYYLSYVTVDLVIDQF